MLVPPVLTALAIAASSYLIGLATYESGDTYRLTVKVCSIAVVLSVALCAQRQHVFDLIESLRGRAYENGGTNGGA